MKLMIASDIHGSALYCRALMEAYKRERAERLLLLGDLLYHGPRNDLPAEYAPRKVISMLNAMKESILCVRGNCDTEVDQMVLEFPIMAEYCLLDMDGQTILATHGHVYNPSNPPMLKGGDILLNGHTHVPACRRIRQTKQENPAGLKKSGSPKAKEVEDSKEEKGSFWYMNPGSVSIPKENSERGYMTVEQGTFEWKNMEGQVYRTWKKDLHC